MCWILSTFCSSLRGLFYRSRASVVSIVYLSRGHLYCPLSHTRLSIDMPANTSFLDLPAEARHNILRYLLVKPPMVGVDNTTVEVIAAGQLLFNTVTINGLWVNILLTCRQLMVEGRDILYCHNKFEIHANDIVFTPANFLATIGSTNVARLRHLTLGNRHGTYYDARHPLRMIEWLYDDRWVMDMFRQCPQLQLDVLAINVDWPPYRPEERLVPRFHWDFVREFGLEADYRWAVSRQHWPIIRAIKSEVALYCNYLGIVRATRSMERVCPTLTPNIYWGRYKYGGYAIFSRKPLAMVEEAPYEKLCQQVDLFPVSFRFASGFRPRD